MTEGNPRRIVFVNQATGYLTIDIINAFVGTGRFANVALIAGSIRVQDVALEPTVEWTRISLYNRGNPRKKFLSWLWGSFQIGWRLLTKYRTYEVFYITIPPFAYLWSLVLPNRFSILVFDVYPDVLSIYNIHNRNIMYKAWAWANRRLFRRVHKLYTLGDGMARLLAQYVELEKVHVIPNWSGLTNIRPIDREANFFLKDQGLSDKFIVQYSGNIGYTHNVEVLVELAGYMKEHNDIFFLIIGRGERFSTIQQKVEQERLTNCRLLPFQPDDILNYTLSAASLGVVILDDKTAHVSMPSKIYNLQAVGTPIMGIADKRSALALHVEKHDNGRCFARTELSAMASYILDLKGNHERMNELRSHSRVAAKEYTSSNANRYAGSYV